MIDSVISAIIILTLSVVEGLGVLRYSQSHTAGYGPTWPGPLRQSHLPAFGPFPSTPFQRIKVKFKIKTKEWFILHLWLQTLSASLNRVLHWKVKIYYFLQGVPYIYIYNPRKEKMPSLPNPSPPHSWPLLGSHQVPWTSQGRDYKG